MAQRPAIVVDGVEELVRALRKVDRSLATGIQGELRAAAQSVALTAREIAAAKGLAPPGRSGRGRGALVRSIRTSVRGGSAYIRETATRDGYAYPRVYEYGHGSVRAFMQPAVERAAPDLLRRIEHLLDSILSGAAFTTK